MRSILISAGLLAIALVAGVQTAQAKDKSIGQLSCDLTHRAPTVQNTDLQITCVFYPKQRGLHHYYMGHYAVRKDVAKATPGLMRWKVYTALPAKFNGLSGRYKLAGFTARPASATLRGGHQGAISLRPLQYSFNGERNFAGHVGALTLLWGR